MSLTANHYLYFISPIAKVAFVWLYTHVSDNIMKTIISYRLVIDPIRCSAGTTVSKRYYYHGGVPQTKAIESERRTCDARDRSCVLFPPGHRVAIKLPLNISKLEQNVNRY